MTQETFRVWTSKERKKTKVQLRVRVRVRPVTAAAQRVCLSESLQSWWDNEVRPGAPDLWFCVFHRATNTTWQLAALISFHLGCAACQHTSRLPSPSPSTSTSTPKPISVNTWPTVCWLAISAGPLAWPCMLGFPIVSPGVPHTLLSHTPPAGQGRPARILGGRDRAQVRSCAVTVKWANCCLPWLFLNHSHWLMWFVIKKDLIWTLGCEKQGEVFLDPLYNGAVMLALCA